MYLCKTLARYQDLTLWVVSLFVTTLCAIGLTLLFGCRVIFSMTDTPIKVGDILLPEGSYELVEISKLKEHVRNAKHHPEDQIKRLAKIIGNVGFRLPVIVSNLSGCIVKGHCTRLAVKSLGWTHVPVCYQDFEDEAEEYAFLISENAIQEWGVLELAKINNDFLDLGPDFDIELLGIKDFELNASDSKYDEEKEDETPSVPKETIIKLGDVIELGNHRLMCGDSTDILQVEKLMNGEKADMVFTSPPYNGNTHLDYGNGNNKKLYNNNKADDKNSEEYVAFCHDILNLCFSFCNGFVFWNVNYNGKSRFEYIKGIFPFIENYMRP